MAKRLKRAGDYTGTYGWIIDDSCEVTCERCTRGKLGPNSDYWGAQQDHGEVDSPNHCANCGVLMPNALTSHGMDYVREQCENATGDPVILALWREHFPYAFEVLA